MHRDTPCVDEQGCGPTARAAALSSPSAPPLPSARGTSRLRAAVGRARTGLAQARRLWRDFTGESAYERYVERHRREHPGHEPMTERQWWRAKTDFDEDNVQARCC